MFLGYPIGGPAEENGARKKNDQPSHHSSFTHIQVRPSEKFGVQPQRSRSLSSLKRSDSASEFQIHTERPFDKGRRKKKHFAIRIPAALLAETKKQYSRSICPCYGLFP
jgi:hypothetical protein